MRSSFLLTCGHVFFVMGAIVPQSVIADTGSSTGLACDYDNDAALKSQCVYNDDLGKKNGAFFLGTSRFIAPSVVLPDGAHCVTSPDIAGGPVRNIYDKASKKCIVTNLRIDCVGTKSAFREKYTGARCQYDPCYFLKSFKCYYKASIPSCQSLYGGKGLQLKSIQIIGGLKPEPGTYSDVNVTNFGSVIYGPVGPNNDQCISKNLNARIKIPPNKYYSNVMGLRNCVWTYNESFETADAGKLTVKCDLNP